jgi:hypothetical protein
MGRIKLPKELAIRLYFVSYQAARSLHKGLGAPWGEFRTYYSEERVNALRKVLADFRAKIRCADREGLASRIFVSWWLPNRWKTWFGLSESEILHLEFALVSFLNVLASSEKPESDDYLIAVRMALTNCAILMDESLVSDGEEVDHFGRANWLKPVLLDQLLQKSGYVLRAVEFDGERRQVATFQSSGDSKSLG